ncbi:tRNA 2-selenouridine(34) synthase MnmH [Psychromonas antarctica]|jgi:tRNA 2-selenouridine synthase|uniref:tRNA 2-selenouridine(34) synthase MnmH n=1 Tax=Psychromonas antarctica TaxID=67573 RepID=UPI001EE7DDA7|nr:tRNA 2-selenouridine(34) synthase MnmH [Psychromonas antarctica]MCG6199982.1 tRNA 2-selenouridine(34) synthase MnmH [Psychromonas antarctica]
MVRNNSRDFRDIFLNDTPMIDVRAPVEFSLGAYPSSRNYPLMLDDERAAVGLCYKDSGQDAAIELGHRLVSGDKKAQRVAQWKAFCEENPQGYLYCFRGGMRSRITQQWLKEVGIDYPFIEGGYKAMRSYLLDTLESISEDPITIIAGCTGSGKTDLIKTLKNGLDLEGVANHRGSSFGRYVSAQNSQINFDNSLAIDALKKQARGYRCTILEDEGRNIGSVNLPLSLYKVMQLAPIVVIDDPLDIRLGRLLDDYVSRMQTDFANLYGEARGWIEFAAYLEKGLLGIRRRLGNERYANILARQQRAVKVQQETGKVEDHLDWLGLILAQYYDPMYHYQLGKKADRIVYRGDYNEVQAWLVDKHK